MFDDVNRTIEALLKSDLPSDLMRQVSISFATPDDTFPPAGVELPAINVFLFEIVENTQLREFEPTLERRPDGTMLRVPAPAHIDCHYLISVAAEPAIDSQQGELHILGAVLRVLLRYRQLPDSVLRGVLAGKSPPVRAAAVRPGMHPSGVEFWQSLKGKPRATLHYTLTVPVDPIVPEPGGPPVLRLNVGGP